MVPTFARRRTTAVPAVPRRRFLGKLLAALGGGTLLARARDSFASTDPPVVQGVNPYIGEIMMFAGNFPPDGWAFCHGQLLAISQNTALFTILGTTYGGNGQTTFALPDLRGRAPMHHGQGPGLSLRDLGEVVGSEAITLTQQQMPAHTHAARATTANGTTDNPNGTVPARNAGGVPAYAAVDNTNMSATSILPAGGNQPHDNMPPRLAISFCIALEGIYPSQGSPSAAPRN